MASDCHFTDSISKEEEEDEEFDRMLKRIGGKGNIYLVGDADGENNCSLFQEFIMDVFHTEVHIKRDRNANLGNGIKCAAARNCPVSDGAQGKGDNNADVDEKRVRHQRKTSGHDGRAIHCAVIVFIFRHGYIQNKANRMCMEEILKDVKVRVKKNHGVRQALLGLVHADAESSETHQSVTLLEETLRSVFVKHPHDSIWTGHFIPNAADGIENIKRNACKAVNVSQSPDNILSRKRNIFWLCSGRWIRRGRRQRAEAMTHAQAQNGDPESTEEGIPLQMKSGSQS
ncbi:hypothetical protein PHYPO_G00024260 [Pangasianodon hypophthalmus]|uniref:Uncharacterized protein n=1 Tax=Pangasianodon hypophthalmus TaxID=310915 RepID=A0A5N5MVI4_PANHP|nr:uncharacterized protein LOC113536618 [Pangasianodon hypophthalmus]KAB5559039.1 hypothetical protein PHYPO_G00024260 [Pangasianodon hypophthalmus]